MRFTTRLGAEFLGTFVLVFGGTGSAVLAATFLTPVGADTGLGIGFLGVSLAFGLTVLTMAYAVGHLSGGHFNPAITLGLAAVRRFEWKEAIPYLVTQVLAAIAASATLWVIAVNHEGTTKDAAHRPAERFPAERIRPTLRRRRRRCAPAASATRTIAPRLPGSCTSTATTTSGAAPRVERFDLRPSGRSASATIALGDRTGLIASITGGRTRASTSTPCAPERGDERLQVVVLERRRASTAAIVQRDAGVDAHRRRDARRRAASRRPASPRAASRKRATIGFWRLVMVTPEG